MTEKPGGDGTIATRRRNHVLAMGAPESCRHALASVGRCLALVVFISPAVAESPAVANLPPDERPEWLGREGLVMAGSWEQMTFRVRRDRRGDTPPEWEAPNDGRDYRPTPQQADAWRRERSDEMIERLKRLGVNFVMIPAYKGAGMVAERKDMEDVVEWAGRCHQAGLHVGVYADSETLLWELFFREKPEATDWLVRGQDGQPRLYSRSQPFRYIYNRLHPDAHQYYLDVLMECNPHGVLDRTYPPKDHFRLVRFGEAFWDEARGPDPSGLKGGELRTRIRSYKVARLLGNMVFCKSGTPLELAESMAFNLDYLGAIRGACARPLSLELAGVEQVGLCAELIDQPDRRLVHLVNYRSDGPLENVALAVRIPQGREVAGVRFSGPAHESDLDVSFQQHGDTVHFDVSRVDIYEVAVLRWRNAEEREEK